MTSDEIAWLGIEELTQSIARDARSVTEVAEGFLARIEQHDSTLGAYACVWPDRVRERAASLDREKAQLRKADPELQTKPLFGIPIALKDLCDVAGEPTRAGTTALGDEPALEDAEVVERLEAAGAIILGKVKMTEGAFTTHHSSVTPPVNPWNANRWTGISSSGSGVAVAGGLCTAALGTDTGGSIRFPSAACGLTGLKPTHGRVSLRGVFPLADSLDHIGPMARSVADVERLFSVLAGFDPRDPWSRAMAPPKALPSIAKARGRTIGFDPRFCEEGVSDEVAHAFRASLDVYRELGARVLEIEMPSVAEAMGAWVHLGSAEIATAHAETYARKKDEYGSELAASIEAGLQVSGRDVAHAWKTRSAFARRLEGCFIGGADTCPAEAPEGLDAIAAPVIPGLFPANTNLSDLEANPQVVHASRFASPFNLSGSPSLTMNAGFDGDSAPIGFQLVGAAGGEGTLCALGRAYQGATDWHHMHPALD